MQMNGWGNARKGIKRAYGTLPDPYWEVDSLCSTSGRS